MQDYYVKMMSRDAGKKWLCGEIFCPLNETEISNELKHFYHFCIHPLTFALS